MQHAIAEYIQRDSWRDIVLPVQHEFKTIIRKLASSAQCTQSDVRAIHALLHTVEARWNLFTHRYLNCSSLGNKSATEAVLINMRK